MVKNLLANAGGAEDSSSILRLGRFPWRRKWQLTSVFLPGKSQGQGSLEGYNPQGHKSQTQLSARAHTHTHRELDPTCSN